MLKLEPLVTYRAELAAPIDIGTLASGNRQIYNVTGGHFEGPRLRGKLLASGGDWLLVGSDGVGRLDVRAALETDDGARIYVHYHGILVLGPVMEAVASNGTTEYGDTTFMIQPRFETGHSDYAWLNSIVAVGEGRMRPSAVEYRVFGVASSPDSD